MVPLLFALAAGGLVRRTNRAVEADAEIASLQAEIASLKAENAALKEEARAAAQGGE